MASDAALSYPGKDLEAMDFAVNYHRWILEESAPYIGGRVAEVGAGRGSFSQLLLEKPLAHLSAFEPSADMFPLLRQALGQDERARSVYGFFRSPPSGELFDSVLYINVLEHIEDDGAELVRVYQALKPGGHVVLFVPALEWLYSPFDAEIHHFRRYTKKSLREVTLAAGFEILKARYFDFLGIIPWYVNFVLLQNRLNGGNVALYDKFVVPLTRVLEGMVTPPIGKNLLLIGRKG